MSSSIETYLKNTVLGFLLFQRIKNAIDGNLNTNFELEARLSKIRYINPKEYAEETGWDFEDFERLKDFLSKLGEPEVTHAIDYTRKSDNLRQTIQQNPDGSERIYNIKKFPIFNSQELPKVFGAKKDRDFKKEYGIKLSLAKETKEIETTEKIKNYDLSRVKHRYSWILENFNVRFDLTKVIQTNDGVNNDKYEVELEMIAPQLKEQKSKMTQEDLVAFVKIYSKFSKFVEDALKILHNSDNFYSYSDINSLAFFINTKLDARKYIDRKQRKTREAFNNPKKFVSFDAPTETHISDEFFTKLRPLKKFDLDEGGLMFGKYKYTVTPKAEGMRKFLVIHTNGVWLFSSAPEETNYCLVYKNSDKEYENWKNYMGTIIDGEDIKPDDEKEQHRKGNYPDIKHYYLPFDTLLFKGNDVRNENLHDRQSYLSIIKTIGNTDKLLIEEKPFYDLGSTLETMYESIKKCVNHKSFSYETDGIVFTPINEEYNPQNDVYKKNRNLLKFSDIVKWKPLEKISMDLQIEYNSSSRKFYSSGPMTEFKGDDRNIFDPETQVDWYDPLFNEIKNGDIVEMGPKFVEGNLIRNNDGNVILRPFRVRYDKTYPNGTNTVEDIWKDINDPLEIETLLGKDDTLLRQYHNDVKRRLFSNIKGNQRTGSHLIDIGAGRGGDLSKYKSGHFTKILAIEPYEPNYKEFLRRLSQKSNDDIRTKINTLMCGGEEYQLILQKVKETFGDELGKAPLTISMMLSLSFFWLNGSSMLYKLANTINLIKEAFYDAGGKSGELRFIFLTIEGERTYNLLTSNDNYIKLNNTTLSYYPEKEMVLINIPDSIVTQQEEGLVNLFQLRNLTNMDVVYEKDASGDKMLSKDELTLTSLYVYGEYVINNSSFVIYEKSPIEEIKEDKIIKLDDVETPKRRSRTPSPTRPKTPVLETIFDKLENIELKNQDDSKELKTEEENELKLSIKTGYIDDEGYYVPAESNSTLFECIIKYFNPDVPYVPMNEVIKYRNEMALSIRNTNPFDHANRSIFVSAGKGFLKEVSVNKTDAVTWIASDNELSPPYLVWIPDMIGVNLRVNNENYLTTRISNELDTIVLKYENKHYKVKV
jgi:hypothetical protein